MAILHVCAIKDRALATFMQPFTVPALGLAIRSFGDAINDPQHEMHRHPDDYDLFHLATFDTETGAFGGQDEPNAKQGTPRQIAIGKNMQRETPHDLNDRLQARVR